jgi:hypothetical protein
LLDLLELNELEDFEELEELEELELDKSVDLELEQSSHFDSTLLSVMFAFGVTPLLYESCDIFCKL